MELKREKISELIRDDFNGNNARFAHEIDVDPSHIYRFLKTGVGGGKKIYGAIFKLCKEKGYNIEDYIKL
jgi:hypothetical protein